MAPIAGGSPKSYITELYLSEPNRRFGFRVGGLMARPTVVVGCQSARARQVYQRLLLILGLNGLKERLFLISLDRPDDLQELGRCATFSG